MFCCLAAFGGGEKRRCPIAALPPGTGPELGKHAMNRARIFVPVLFLFLVAPLVWVSLSSPDSKAPKFVASKIQPAGPFGRVFYDWGGAVPFAGGKVWIFTVPSRTNHSEFLFDLEQRKVLGELINGAAVFANQEETRLLCEGHESLNNSVEGRVAGWLKQLSFGKLRFNTNRIDTYWILDLRNNSARRVGELSQWPGTGSRWRPSPGFRFGCNVPNNSEEGSSFFVCDLGQETFHKIRFTGSVRGWWDDQRLLIKKPAGDLVLYDVLGGSSSTLFSLDTLSRRLAELGIHDDPATLITYSIWRGSNYEFNLVAKQGWNWYSNGTFMVRVDRSGPALTLAHQNFKFRWLGSFNATETQYVYDGESGEVGRGGNGGVFLLDLASNTITTLVLPDNKGQYAGARFYGDEVVYSRDHELWGIRSDGLGATRLFPPPGE